MSRRRGVALELAVLGLLADSPMHGYELRKQVNGLLGWSRLLSYGTLYPCLKALGRDGYIVADEDVPQEMQDDPELWSGCISGAYREDAFLSAFTRQPSSRTMRW